MCGEKQDMTTIEDYLSGSPPHVRGKAVPAALPDVTHGITPAHAGKSGNGWGFGGDGGDHPRVCGEKPMWRIKKLTELGSPPRVRGKAPVQ